MADPFSPNVLALAADRPCWRVVRAVAGGLLVRSGRSLTAGSELERLARGALVEELELHGDRLHYRLLAGHGPPMGWVCVRASEDAERLRHKLLTGETLLADTVVMVAGPPGKVWRVTGGEGRGGIIVRTERPLDSPKAPERLATGAIVEEMDRDGDRICYRLLDGTGPIFGWVTVRVSDGVHEKALLVEGCEDLEDGCGFGKRLRLCIREEFEEALELVWQVVDDRRGEDSEDDLDEEFEPSGEGPYPATVEMILLPPEEDEPERPALTDHELRNNTEAKVGTDIMVPARADEAPMVPARADEVPPPEEDGIFVKRVDCDSDCKVKLHNMPPGRTFAVSVVLSFGHEGRLRSEWLQASTLSPADRAHPSGVRGKCLFCLCSGFIPRGQDGDTGPEALCNRCGCHSKDHEDTGMEQKMLLERASGSINHQQTADSSSYGRLGALQKQAAALMKLGQHQQAADVLEQVAESQGRLLWGNWPTALWTYRKLAQCRLEMNELETAKSTFSEVMSAHIDARHGQCHPAVIECMQGYITCCDKLGHKDDADHFRDLLKENRPPTIPLKLPPVMAERRSWRRGRRIYLPSTVLSHHRDMRSLSWDANYTGLANPLRQR